jgi:hypothetical protein
MIIVEISQGLGNQLFQYAAARHLAHIRQTVLKLDPHIYSMSQHRRYGLLHFNLNAEIAPLRDVARICPLEAFPRAIRSVLPGRVSNLAIRALNQTRLKSPYHHRTNDYVPGGPLPSLMVGRIVSERFFHFDPEVLSCPDNTCLAGYWQSEKYFKDISEIIRRELTVKAPLSGKNLEVARQIQNFNSISLHVRRGDKVTLSNHCATSAEYCTRAIHFFQTRLATPKFFVFSDELDWVRNNLSSKADLVFVEHNDAATCHEDLRLMSLCKHNIIAPSSFSWWGAWLNNNPDKIVVRPRAWLNMSNHDTKDALPPDWIVIE